jgi:hypothetical protein
MIALCVVSCGKRKIWDKHPNLGTQKARDVYTGTFSRKCQEYAKAFYPKSWCILSAKYGFVFPDDLIPGPYNVTFYKKETNPLSAEQLAQQAHQLHLDECDRIIVLGGQRYVKMIQQIFTGKEIVKPLAGARGMGYMMKKINEDLSQAGK